jgi:glycosyltransferase involved in cell wall biosynthesis
VLRGLASLGVQTTVLLDRKAQSETLPGIQSVHCLSSPLRGLIRPWWTAWNAAHLLRHARGADLLHFMVEPYAAASLPFGLPPTVITLQGTYAVSPLHGRVPGRPLYAAALRRARSVICVSNFTRRALLSRIKLDNVTVINNGHDVLSPNGQTTIEPKQQPTLQGQPVILGVGALKPRKGYHVALRAIARLRERFPDLRYYIVGDDDDREYVARLRADIAELGLEQHALLMGPVQHDQLAAYYRRADLFLLTPLVVGRSFEGFPIAYMEASAYGKPVVGSLGTSAEEAIVDGVTGLLAPQDDDVLVAERAAAILGDPALAARLGAAGRARAQAQSWEAVARRCLDVYEQALHR